MKEKEGALNLLLDKIESGQNQSKPVAKNKVRRLYFAFSSIAAAACVAAFVFFTFFGVETYHGGIQQASNVVFLPDHSRVVLADGAQLKFSKRFFDRSVQLKGEAYFEVEKGSKFYVKTPSGGVLVIGTRFSVSDVDNILKVHCYEGIVGVDYRNDKIKITEGVQFNGAKKEVEVVENKDFGYAEYAIFKYTCTNVHLNELWPVIEHYFGVKIIDKVDTQASFTGSFNTGNVNEVIDIICTSMKISYQMVDKDQVVIQAN
ncbi:MAG: FecR family protein [Prolixibacteraceae bacterium]